VLLFTRRQTLKKYFKGGKRMKSKIMVIFMVCMFLVGVAAVSRAFHERKVRVIPWESIRDHKERMPIPGGGDLRHHITAHANYKDWEMWPGKGEMYKGTEPHGALLTVYVNDRALKSLKEMKGMANNAIIVKENYAPDKKLMAITVMYRVEGYSPEEGDWFWAKYGADLDILAEGKVKDCITCHSTAKDNDYIFTGKVIGK
jgi:hypothetical protein